MFPLNLTEIDQEKFSSICFGSLENRFLYQPKKSSLVYPVCQVIFIYNGEYTHGTPIRCIAWWKNKHVLF